MTPEHIDRVFGRARLKMMTGAHVEVFREAAAPGESRRYTKRFLTTADGDYAQWTEREWRILARLIGHGTRCIPDVVQYDRGAHGTKLVQTYDAGATVDQWATLLPVERDGAVRTHVFEDCAHWWALAHYCLDALDEIHSLGLVHLDIKADNICIPVAPSSFDPFDPAQRLRPEFRKLALIDFAFSLVSGETLTTALPIGWQQDYDYQSPRLLHALEAGRAGDLQPTESLDWRCDMYSLAAMLKRYLPSEQRLYDPQRASGWTEQHLEAAKLVVLRIREAHDRELAWRPHAELIAETSARVRESACVESLERGWTLARDVQPQASAALPPTPVTRLAPPIRLVIPPREELLSTHVPVHLATPRARLRPRRRTGVAAVAVAAAVAALAFTPLFVGGDALVAATRQAFEGARSLVAGVRDRFAPASDATSPTGTIAAGGSAADDAVRAAASDDGDPQHATPQDAAGAEVATGGDARRAPDTDRPRAIAPTDAAAGAADEASSRPSAGRRSARATPPSSAVQSFADRIEAFRHKSPTAPARTTRAPSSPPAAASRSSAARSAEAARRSSTSASKAARQAPMLASRSPSSVAKPAPSTATARAPAVATSPNAPSTAPSASVRNATGAVIAPAAVDTVGAPAAAANAAMTPSPATPAPASAQVAAPPVSSSGASRAIANATEAPRISEAAPIADASRPAPAANPAMARQAPIVDMSRSALPSDAPRIPPAPEAARATPLVTPAPPQTPPVAIANAANPAASDDEDDDDLYRSRGRWALDTIVPRTAAQSGVQVARVLALAANAYHPTAERAVNDAALQSGVDVEVRFLRDAAPGEARRLHDEAKRAFASRRPIAEVFDLELRAFGANPNDAEIAGQLGYLHLRLAPAQPERARQLALHAIGLRSAHYPTGRPDDWTTLAAASALAGRANDARHALYATLALTRNADRSCRAAIGALSQFGERLREPVESLLYRVHVQGRADESPYCAWPVSRMASIRSP
jgi:hypothetical protein